MALRATIYKTELNVADTDRSYYASHNLTLARHPSETDERLMVRVLAYALYADTDETLEFTRGLSENDEPDLWRKDLTGVITLWIETGLPDERRILKACSRSDAAVIIAYGRNADLWWQGVRNKVSRQDKLTVLKLPADATLALEKLAERKMTLNVNIQDQTAWVSGDKAEATVVLERLQG